MSNENGRPLYDEDAVFAERLDLNNIQNQHNDTLIETMIYDKALDLMSDEMISTLNGLIRASVFLSFWKNGDEEIESPCIRLITTSVNTSGHLKKVRGSSLW